MMKKVFSFLFALMLTASMNAQEHFFYNGILYAIVEEGCEGIYSVEVREANPLDILGDFTIPETVPYKGRDFTVVGISPGAFCESDWLEGSLKLPATIENIGQHAFAGCKKLTELYIPENSRLNHIGESAFEGCKNIIGDLKIPAGVTSIEIRAFMGCLGLKSLSFAENSQLEMIGSEAFDGCTGMRGSSLAIPAIVGEIGDRAFRDCEFSRLCFYPENPPTLGEDVFVYSDNGELYTNQVYVSNLENYGENWGGFKTVLPISLLLEYTIKYALEEINTALDGVTGFSDADKAAIETCIENIKAAQNEKTIEREKAKALAIIKLQVIRNKAIDSILAAMENVGGLTEEEQTAINLCIENIKAATANEESIEAEKTKALDIIKLRAIKNEVIELAYSVEGLNDSERSEIEKSLKIINDATDLEIIEAELAKIQAIIDLRKLKNEAIALANSVEGLNDSERKTIEDYLRKIEEATSQDEVKATTLKIQSIVERRRAKNEAIEEIKKAVSEAEDLTEEDYNTINTCINSIEAAEITAEVYNLKKKALTVISLRPIKNEAIQIVYDFEDLLGDRVEDYIKRINNAGSEKEIKNILAEFINNPYIITGEGVRILTKNDDGQYFLEEPLLNFVEGNYSSNYDFEVRSLNIWREGTQGEESWLAWYEPFDIKLDEQALRQFDAAKLEGILYNSDEEQFMVVFRYMCAGDTMFSNTPYIIHVNEDCDFIELSYGKTLIHKSLENKFTYETPYDIFTFGGNYKDRNNLDWYVMNGSAEFIKMEEEEILQSQRFWMTVTPKTELDDEYKGVAEEYIISTMILGDEAITGINDRTPSITKDENAIYDLKGQKVNSIQSGQVYILNGKKYIGVFY